ncbi:MAG: hypothetical protein JWP81_1330 [Ferruginibacter sp.]|nr:hypothetical protein [Ferruginibacter sp.]
MSRLLDPKILMSIKNLQLAAKTTIDGFMAGINKSKVKGPGLEFSQYRSYQPGDDLRWLDWKMYARSDRYYIRESEIETSISVRLLVDASASMNHSDAGFKKIEYARYIAATLACLANRQGDSVGLYVFQNEQLFSLPSKKDHQHLARLYFQLENIQPGGGFTEPIRYRDIFSVNNKRELLIFITDFYESHGEIIQLLDSLSSLKHEIVVFHLMGKNELEMDYKGYASLQDLETGQVIAIKQEGYKTVYQQKLNDHLSALRLKLLERDIFYRMITMTQPLEQVLRDFLNQRNKLKT